ncbi:MAG: hypothetical protein OXM01_11525 [Gemmatimonadota bacterium]|nr:hypothetical protein [Gemmatimonadota bacterium]
MKRIHTFDEFEAKAARFRALMRQLHGDRAATEGLPQCDRTLGLLVVARQQTPHTCELARDVADMRSTIHQLTNHNPLLYDADTWLVAELVRLKSETNHSLMPRLGQIAPQDDPR